jgi:hypothetical protein
MLLSVMDKIKQLKEQKKAICNANNAADMAAANKDSFNLAGILIGALLGIACIICLMKAMGPNGAGAGSASKASGAPAAMPGASGTPAITNPVYQGPLRTGPAIITA